MFNRPGNVSGIIGSSLIPVFAELSVSVEVCYLWSVWLGMDCEVGMAKAHRPGVRGVIQELHRRNIGVCRVGHCVGTRSVVH